MQNYSFENLNDKEFEVLVNDLISREEGKKVDRFKPGKDAGVDGRFFEIANKEVIIQSKHWLKSGYEALLRRLKKEELKKVKKLNPHRYILATSLPLSNANKNEIKEALSPYIKSATDILGKENLNDLLSRHPDVEKKHYKLWLSSSTVLDAMVNAALTGRSEAKRDEIIEDTKMYVVTQNHKLALEKLEALHSVVITGEGGIGKTTLADQLAHHYVGEEYELCVIEDNLSEAEAYLAKEKKQVFYYDDFLGRNYLMAIEGRKDSRVLGFMDRIERDSTKRFILTSRTTVLKQGKLQSDLLDIKKVDKKEYEITIDSLSAFDRASILYNHIWNGGLSEEHIEELYVDRRYAKIADHSNFNPRLISFITDPDRVSDVSPQDYWSYVVDKLDNPQDVWANVFDNQIDDLTRVAVCLVVFNGSALTTQNLRSAFHLRTIKDGLTNASNVASKFDTMLKTAVGSLLNRSLKANDGSSELSLFNPSVADFVLRRHEHDRQALVAFFLCLNTEASLINLKSLKKSNSISAEVYYWILEQLGTQKISTELRSDHPSYFIQLVHLILADKDAHKPCNASKVLDRIEPIFTKCGFDDHITLVCDILVAALSQKPQIYRSIAKNFIKNSAPNAQSPDQFNSLSKLQKKISEGGDKDDAELLSVLRMEAVLFWMEEAHQLVSEGYVLEDYVGDHDDDHAYISAWDYINDHLEVFDVPDEVISEITDTIDLEQIKEDNRYVISEQETDSFEWNGTTAQISADNLDDQIDDLFDRS